MRLFFFVADFAGCVFFFFFFFFFLGGGGVLFLMFVVVASECILGGRGGGVRERGRTDCVRVRACVCMHVCAWFLFSLLLSMERVFCCCFVFLFFVELEVSFLGFQLLIFLCLDFSVLQVDSNTIVSIYVTG